MVSAAERARDLLPVSEDQGEGNAMGRDARCASLHDGRRNIEQVD